MSWRFHLLLIVLLTGCGHGAATSPSSTLWYGTDARRAELRFTTSVLVDAPTTGEEAREAVDAQLLHMFGAFTEHPGFVDTPGVPSGRPAVEILSVQNLPGGTKARVTYEAEDTAVFHKELLAGASGELTFVLPKDPVAAYHRRCTDEHYFTRDDFWYFWNPYKEGCPLTAADLVKVRAAVRPLNSTRGTYPDYRRLRGDNGNGDDLEVAYLVGIDETFRRGDVGRQVFEESVDGLVGAGFRVTVDEPRRKRLLRDTGGSRTAVTMHLVDPNANAFVDLAAAGMERADVFIYDGHSGLGGHVAVSRLEERLGRPLALPRDKYQVFYFHGCSTYAYYNADYFALKAAPADPRGTKMLDIVTTGIGAAFEIGARADVAFIDGLTGTPRPTWQALIDRIYAVDPELSPLTHVNGDEDNPRTP